ncbi:aldolase/citrate lyase family protein [Microbacterium sp. X-17]|uniref:HpcH/HpaI aldolase family protein n=1 Tax=Microbacterium sp. X-17 TaxID=3144404 RepID=UPI0031F58D4E
MKNVPTIRELLAQKEVLVGAGQYIPHYDYSGLLASAGFDFIFLDAEHGNRGIESLAACINAANVYGVPVIARAMDKTQGDIEQLLDVGASGVMMPAVETVEDAELLVRSARFGPKGDRGWNPMTRWNDYTMSPATIRETDTSIFVAALIETPLGHENLDDILAVDGIDAVMAGPGDLAVKMGAPLGGPETMELVFNAYTKILAAGKIAWSGGGAGAKAGAQHVSAGCRMINGFSDGYMFPYSRGLLNELQAELVAQGLTSTDPAGAPMGLVDAYGRG